MTGANINKPSGGPADRFARTRAKKVQSVMGELHRYDGRTEKQAIAVADEGKEFICKACRQWWLREYFEYVFEGETKLASRCEPCRAENRRRYGKRK